ASLRPALQLMFLTRRFLLCTELSPGPRGGAHVWAADEITIDHLHICIADLLQACVLPSFPFSRKRLIAAFGSSVAIESASQSRAWLIVWCQARSRQKLRCCFA